MSATRMPALPGCLLVVLMLMSPAVLGETEVCQHLYEEYITANCSGRGLERVPYGLHQNIDIMDLSNNRFTTLTAESFKKYSILRVVKLRNNTIRTIHPQALASLDQLHTLDLANNQLMSVPTDVLTLLPGLLTLNLASNNLMLISDEAFMGLVNLKYLDISGNRIGELESRALVGLSQLQVLRLENNNLQSLHRATFENLSRDLLEVHLHNNRWVCDCKLRWLRQWMANDTDSIWQHAGRPILCNGPPLTKHKEVSTIPLDELACKVEMRTSGSTQSVKEGAEAVIECIYFSIPYASPIWHRADVPIDFDAEPGKYTMTVEGSSLVTTQLHVKDFQYKDITKYECLAQNVRGSDSTIFKVTLEGVLFDTVTQATQVGTAYSGSVDTKSIVVAVAVVCGIVVVVGMALVIYCCVGYLRRKEQEKRDAVVENVKKHFLDNTEVTPSKEVKEFDKSKLSQFNDIDSASDSNRTSDTNTSHPKHSVEGPYPGKEPLYTFQQPGSPFANGNTYVSFGSETDPELVPMYPQANSTSRYEGSHTESTTPLLDRYTPSVFDSDDPLDDSLPYPYPYPLYEAATLYHPRRNHFPELMNGSCPPLTPGSTRSNTRSTTFIPANSGRHPDYQDYRELRYPYNSTPQQRMLSSKKSMSVGNLGHVPAPRKPPRIFHSREYVEMSPHDTSGSASEYMTVPQQNYYGIKPGTPV
ncbi:leucine-rich repeat-containing protein 24-like [Littorina saxatilis]|uniref:Ig-like domain-containing protein n=1 Tax=Littorina saxatilis TaxID=31220 RepID=A0AAN9G604_9CAEN